MAGPVHRTFESPTSALNPSSSSSMSTFANAPDRRMSMPDTSMVMDRPKRSRSRPNSRAGNNAKTPSNLPPHPASATESESQPTSSPGASSMPSSLHRDAASPYSRSPELRVSHKLAERKRRKEMKELFDELRDQLPADRGMKASKWEILSKAVDYITYLKNNWNDSQREIEHLRMEVEQSRGGHMSPVNQNPPIVHSQGPSNPFPIPKSSDAIANPSPGPNALRNAPVNQYVTLNGSRRTPPM